MITVLKNNHIDAQAWDNLLELSPTASWFQSYNCYQFYKQLSFMKPFAYAVKKDNHIQALVCGYIISNGGFLKQFMSRRAIVPGGVLLTKDCSHEALTLLLNTLRVELKSKVIYTEFRNYFDYSEYKEIFEKTGYKYQAHLNFQVATPSVEHCLKQLSSTKRRDVKLSLKQGTTVEKTTDDNDVRSYYDLLFELYKTKVKTPLFSFQFFKILLTLAESHLFIIKYEGKVVGGSMCVGTEGKVLYEWFVCGLDGRFKNVYPSTLATWAAIEYAATNGFSYFDMMGAGKPDEGYGVRDFKAKFGGELLEHGRFLCVHKPVLYSAGKKVITFIKSKK